MATRKQTPEAETEAQPKAEAQPRAEAEQATAKAEEGTEQAMARAQDAVVETAEAGAEAGEDVREEVASSADAALDTVVLGQQQALERAEASGQAMMDGVTRFQREIADFVSERLRHDMEIQQELLRCRSFDEVRSVQARFFQTAVDQYSAEATKLMRLGQEMMQRTLSTN